MQAEPVGISMPSFLPVNSTTFCAMHPLSDLKGLRSLLDQTLARKAYVVCLEKRPRLLTTPEGRKIHITPWRDFLAALWNHDIIS